MGWPFHRLWANLSVVGFFEGSGQPESWGAFQRLWANLSSQGTFSKSPGRRRGGLSKGLALVEKRCSWSLPLVSSGNWLFTRPEHLFHSGTPRSTMKTYGSLIARIRYSFTRTPIWLALILDIKVCFQTISGDAIQFKNALDRSFSKMSSQVEKSDTGEIREQFLKAVSVFGFFNTRFIALSMHGRRTTARR